VKASKLSSGICLDVFAMDTGRDIGYL